MHKLTFKQSKKINWSYTLLTVILCTAIIGLYRWYLVPDYHDLGFDVFYHVKLSDMFPDFIFIKKFPWTQLSIWKNCFYDKELGFHIIIHFIRTIQELLNQSISPPFNTIDIFFVFLILSIYSFGCYLTRLKYSFLVPILMITISPMFLFRLLIIRPHLISIILFGITLFTLLSKLSYKRKAAAVFLIAVAYGYFYSSPHLILLPVVAYIAGLFISSGFNKKSVKYLLLIPLAILGITFAYMCHPQFPNTFIAWYIQSAMVMKNILLNSSHGLRIGQEAYGATAKEELINIATYVLTLINLFLFIKNKNKSPQLITLLIVCTISLLGFSLSKRFIEYCVPANTLFFIYQLNKTKWKKTIKKVHWAALLILFSGLFFYNYSKIDFSHLKTKPFNDFAQWLNKNIPPKTYIAQINWSTFPFLFYASNNYYYSSALDPMFTYAAYPEKAIKLKQYRYLEKVWSPKELSNILNSNLVFVCRKDPHIAVLLNKQGVKFLYQGKDGWLFDLSSVKHGAKLPK